MRDDRAYFEQVIARIDGRERSTPLDASRALDHPARRIYDAVQRTGLRRTPATEQLDFVADGSAPTALVLTRAYTGKALFGLSRLAASQTRALCSFIPAGCRVLLAEAHGSSLPQRHGHRAARLPEAEP